MARSFTLFFYHDDEEYTAVVSQLKDTVCIYIPDLRLHHLIPNGKFTFHSKAGLQPDQYQDPLKSLLKELWNAIEVKMQTQQNL